MNCIVDKTTVCTKTTTRGTSSQFSPFISVGSQSECRLSPRGACERVPVLNFHDQWFGLVRKVSAVQSVKVQRIDQGSRSQSTSTSSQPSTDAFLVYNTSDT